MELTRSNSDLKSSTELKDDFGSTDCTLFIDYVKNNYERGDMMEGLPFVVHEFGYSQAALVAALETISKEVWSIRGGPANFYIEFLCGVVRFGRPFSHELLERMKAFYSNKRGCEGLIKYIDAALNWMSPILGRWRMKSPREDLLYWMQWKIEQVCDMLTLICQPFFSLRPWEFDEKKSGPHLRDLNSRCTALTAFVTSSILTGSCVVKEKGIEVTEQWLKIGEGLLERRNYHMAFALQNGLAKFQVDRLTWLWKGLSRAGKKRKQTIDAFFDPTNRMQQFLDAVKENLGKKPMIPCIFWLVQKSVLLKECPLFVGDDESTLNSVRLIAAKNVFMDNLVRAQSVAYPKVKEQEEILFYFLRLERGSIAFFDEKVMDSFSDYCNTSKSSTDVLDDANGAVPLTKLEKLKTRLRDPNLTPTKVSPRLNRSQSTSTAATPTQSPQKNPKDSPFKLLRSGSIVDL